MPKASWFAYAWPNRRSDKPVVEVTLDFKPADRHRFPQRAGQVRDLLVEAGILAAEEPFPQQELPQERMAWYTSLLLQSALLFQRKAGHRVDYFSVHCDPQRSRCMGLLEHEHCDVGMTAVKLAVEMMSGERKLLAEPFRTFSEFARERLLPRRTEAIIEAARRRDIPVIHLERSPYKRSDWDALTNGECICPNGLVMLGHGRHQRVLDGTWSLDLQEDLAPVDGAADDPETEIPARDVERLLDRLFPGGAPVRMPIIAVTGTNGKTTTVRMLDHIMRQAGLKSGMVCSNGTFLDTRQVDERPACTDTGHLLVLTSKDVDIAVLETHHAGIMARGFCFDWCDIAVCTNVTNDHLGVGNIDTVEQMAELKQALPLRARRAAVLNADDQHCLAMAAGVTAERVCLVSVEKNADDVREATPADVACCCVLERIDEREWLVIHDRQRRVPVSSVDAIPATFNGTARFNVSNAMHAALAAYLVGIVPPTIKSALEGFASGHEATPGRLNVFEGFPFRVIMDYAHNLDGFRQVVEFIDRQPVAGRKILVVSQLGDRQDEDIRQSMASVAGHFDHYVCRNYHVLRGRSPDTIPALLKETLISMGIAEASISTVEDPEEAVRYSLSIARPRDLVVILVDDLEVKTLWQSLSELAVEQSG